MKTVDCGAAFLDLHMPGWAGLINTDTLDLSSTCDCVLGQLYRYDHPRLRTRGAAYFKKVAELRLGGDDARRLGFVTWGDDCSWSLLTQAWQRVIRARLPYPQENGE